MPIHDWTRVPPGLFHHFHQDWSVEIARTLNRGLLTKGYYALVEQRVDGPEPDGIAVQTDPQHRTRSGPSASGTGVASPPRTRFVTRMESDAAVYASKANRISVRHPLGETVAVIEIVSPGNKNNRHGIRAFVEKAAALLRAGVHLLVIDLFPPGPRDPQGIHQLIQDEFKDEPFDPPADKPLTLVAYAASYPRTAYIEPVAVGDPLPDMPLYIAPEEYVLVPLEATYQATWVVTPEPIRERVTDPTS